MCSCIGLQVHICVDACVQRHGYVCAGTYVCMFA